MTRLVAIRARYGSLSPQVKAKIAEVSPCAARLIEVVPKLVAVARAAKAAAMSPWACEIACWDEVDRALSMLEADE